VAEDEALKRVTERKWMRLVASNVILHLHPTRVPAKALRFTYTWGLGGISTLLCLMLVGTGILLMFRYEPSIAGAYLSVQAIETTVPFGSLVRAIHHWSANLLVVTAFLHLVRVFLTGGYKMGRAVNWVVGIGFFALILAFNFTGYLLPWDQLSYWAITVSMSLVAYLSGPGEYVNQLLLGGPEVGQGALSNFYALHVAVLPVLLFLMASYHYWKVRRDGGISQPISQRGKGVERVTTIPHLVQIEFAVATAVTVVLITFAMWRPAPLGPLANPLQSPNPAKAAWYFMGLQELLLHMHTAAFLALLGVLLAAILSVPWWDRDQNIGVYFRSETGRRAALLGAILAMNIVPLLVVADEYWVDLPALFPHWPQMVSNGIVPFLLTLLGLATVYLVVRRGTRANRGEGVVGLFCFIAVSAIVLTLIGVYCRGPNMALIRPF